MKRYEGMFLFDNTSVHQWSEMEAEVRRLCDRIGADLLVCVKFDERKLAYEIQRRKRGTYVLTYFDADPSRIGDLERDARLSEVLLRTLVLRAEQISEERLATLKALPPDQPMQPMSGDGRRGEGGRPRDRWEPSRAPRADEKKAEAAPKKLTEPAPEPASATATETAIKAEPESPLETAPQAPPTVDTPETRPAED